MGTKKKPAPRRKGPATGNGKPAVKVQAPRPRKPRSDKGTKVSQPLPPVPPAIISRIEPIPAKEIERRSDEVRASARQPVIGEHLRDDVPGRAGDIALTVLFILFVVFVLAFIARSAV